MIAAGFDLGPVFVVIAIIVGIVNWLTKKGETENDNAPSPKFPRPKPSAQPDEERLRKFLEALGVPADQAPPRPVQKRPLPPGPPALPTIPARPPIVAGPPITSLREKARKLREQVAPQAPPRMETAKPRPVARERSLDEADTTKPVERIRLRELQTAAMPEFVTTSSSITAIPFDAPLPAETDHFRITEVAAIEPPADSVRRLLKSPADVRAAMVLREILGSPRGLQPPGTLPSFS